MMENKIAKANRVREWYTSDIIKEVFRLVEDDIVRMWIESTSYQESDREILYRELHGLKSLRARIKRIINEGVRAEELNRE